MRKEKFRNIGGKVGVAAINYGKDGEYWLNKFSGDLKKNTFPYDYPKSKLEKKRLDTIMTGFTNREVSRLMELSKGLDHRLYIILAAGVVALLYKYTGEKDIIFGSPIFKQDREGNFVNTVLPLRVRLQDHMTFKELLLQPVRQTIKEASEHQNYPIETLLFQLNMPFTGNDFPLFDVAVLLENIHEKKYISYIHPNILFSFSRANDGAGILAVVDYNTALYKRNTLERIVGHLKCLIDGVIFNIDTPLSKIELLNEEERRQLLVDFNNTKTAYPARKTIDELFREQVSRTPGKTAVTYEGEPLTYKELNEKSDALASYLHFIGVTREEPVAVMAENSYNVIAALLAILKAGAAYLSLNVDYPDDRKQYILNDCNSRILLTRCREKPDYDFPLVAIDLDNHDWNNFKGKKDFLSHHGSDNLAYIMYTSGSTGAPKGVMVRHNSVVRLVRNTDYIEFKQGDSILLTGALEFDASTFEIWGALLNGLTLHLVSKETLLLPHKLKDSLGKYKVSTIWMTSPLFNQMVDVDIEICNGLKNLLVGGDVLSPTHIGRVMKRFPQLTVINGYGPTENTTFSLTHRLDRVYEENIPIGKPISNSTAYILDRSYGLVPIGIAGEIYVGGEGLSRGYLNHQELTEEKFIPNPLVPGEEAGPDGERLYATGDLGRWLPDGTIEFLGRMDHQVKLRGYRIEPGEIENRLMHIDIIDKAVVMDRKNRDGEKYLCAYIVAKKNLERNLPSDTVDIGELRKILLEQLPDYMVPDYFVPLAEIPLTSNGKVDRRALPEPEINSIGAPYMPPRNRLEEKMTDIWSRVLKVDRALVGIDSDFFELGGHSLKATILISKLHEAFHVKVPLAELFHAPTIRELAEYINSLKKEKFYSIPVVEKKEYYELSSAQKRLYILQQMELNSTAYNIPMAVLLEGDPEPEKLEATFRELIQRHESLRTSFEIINGSAVQRIHTPYQTNFAIQYGEAAEGKERADILPDFARPFNLSQAPLMRVGLIKEAQNRYLLLVDIHHIVIDGTSMDIFIDEFTAAYSGDSLVPLKLQYKDFSEWQNREKQRSTLKKEEEFWLKTFAGEIPVLELPTDYPRPAVQSFEGDRVNFNISAEENRALNEMALKGDYTLFMVMVAVVNILLSKLSGQEEIIIGTPIAGRRHADLEKIIGMFVNTLSLRNYPAGDRRFREFLGDVKERTLMAFENQEYPFEELVDKLPVKRDIRHNPLFDIMFVLQNINTGLAGQDKENEMETSRPVQPDSPKEYENIFQTAKFDLTLSAMERGRGLFLSFHYCTKLFKKDTIERFIIYFKKIVSIIVKKPGMKLSEIDVISEEEKRRLLYDFNDTEADYPMDNTIHQLFEEQVERTPDNIALHGFMVAWIHGEEGAITYKELNEKANQLAYMLQAKGVGPDIIVGIIMERSVEMIVEMLGILKSGGAYLPIDPEYPKDRINYMLNDSGTKLLVTTNDLEGVRKLGSDEVKKNNETTIFANIVNIKVMEESPNLLTSQPPSFNLLPATGHRQLATSLAYVIYTSGTTGKPKGAMINHQNLVNYIYWFSHKARIKSEDKSILISSFAFDLGYTSLYPTLLAGGESHILSRDIYMSPPKLIDYINMKGITYIKITPSLLGPIVDSSEFTPVNCLTLRLAVIGGEAIKPEAVEKVHQICPHLEIINHYGPTEATIGCIALYIDFQRFDEYKVNPTIGKPISNSAAFLLDKDFNLLPVGVPGELCISGAGVCRGYLNNSELTSDKFISPSSITNNFSPLYKTGDLGRWMPDGNIEFLGRIDQQVKVRGYRIELGEIESQLLKYKNIREVAVIAKELPGRESEKYLCAYIVSNNQLLISELREYLPGKLPTYMIPSHFVILDKIPLTPNGKVDRKALPEPETGINVGEYIAPRDEIEKKLVRVWAEVLNIEEEKMGIESNFFELGGQSLSLIQLVSKIHQEFGIEIPITQIYKNPIIKEIANQLKSKNFSESSVVLLNQPNERKIFCFPPQVGYGFYYSDLAMNMQDFSFYAFSFIEDDDRLKQYVETITGIQPLGPYILFGYSKAGALIFEVTKALEESGCAVSDVIMADCLFKEGVSKNFEELDLTRFYMYVDEVLDRFDAHFLREKVIKKAENYQRYGLTITSLEAINANVHLILSEQLQEMETVDPNCWQKFTNKTYTIYKGFGGHQTMFNDEPLKKNAMIIREILMKIHKRESHLKF